MISNENTSNSIVRSFWAAMQSNDFRAASEFLHDEYLLEWPQSGERIRGRDNFIAINEHYPAAGRWSFTVNRLIGEGDQVVTDVTVTDGVIIAHSIAFSTIRNGKILFQTEYWPDPFDAADWRARWVEKIEKNDE